MAEQPKFKIESFSWGTSFDEPITITGTIRYVDKRGGCWAIIADDDPPMLVQLEGLDPEFQRDGLRVVLTAHIEEDTMGDCIPFMLFFVDEVAAI